MTGLSHTARAFAGFLAPAPAAKAPTAAAGGPAAFPSILEAVEQTQDLEVPSNGQPESGPNQFFGPPAAETQLKSNITASAASPLQTTGPMFKAFTAAPTDDCISLPFQKAIGSRIPFGPRQSALPASHAAKSAHPGADRATSQNSPALSTRPVEQDSQPSLAAGQVVLPSYPESHSEMEAAAATSAPKLDHEPSATPQPGFNISINLDTAIPRFAPGSTGGSGPKAAISYTPENSGKPASSAVADVPSTADDLPNLSSGATPVDSQRLTAIHSTCSQGHSTAQSIEALCRPTVATGTQAPIPTEPGSASKGSLSTSPSNFGSLDIAAGPAAPQLARAASPHSSTRQDHSLEAAGAAIPPTSTASNVPIQPAPPSASETSLSLAQAPGSESSDGSSAALITASNAPSTVHHSKPSASPVFDVPAFDTSADAVPPSSEPTSEADPSQISSRNGIPPAQSHRAASNTPHGPTAGQLATRLPDAFSLLSTTRSTPSPAQEQVSLKRDTAIGRVPAPSTTPSAENPTGSTQDPAIESTSDTIPAGVVPVAADSIPQEPAAPLAFRAVLTRVTEVPPSATAAAVPPVQAAPVAQPGTAATDPADPTVNPSSSNALGSAAPAQPVSAGSDDQDAPPEDSRGRRFAPEAVSTPDTSTSRWTFAPAAVAAAPAYPEYRSQPSAPSAPPTPDLPTPPKTGAQPVRDIKFDLGTGDGRVEVRVEDRGGEVRVAVHTPDTRLAGDLRDHLPSLSSRLEQSGLRAETWHAATGPGERLRTGETAQGSQAQQEQGNHPNSRERQQDAPPRRPRPAASADEQKGNDFAWLMDALR